jgi:FMN-dependent oxidoreductase (nitrilotriacetate monooxygenase family)
VQHDGPFYRIDAIHLSEPSPQRTPVLFQAGSSDRGRVFAASHAECVFINGQSKVAAKRLVDEIRADAVARGRAPHDIKVFVGATVIVGRTEAQAQAKYADYQRYASPEAGLAHFSASTGIDFSRYGLDDPIDYVQTEAMTSAVEAVTKRSTDQVWTVRKLLELMKLGSRNRAIVGDASQVADELQSWVREAGVDGFNLIRTVAPEGFEDFVDLVVPELQRRGVYKTEYAQGTLREKIFGAGHARLSAPHPAARWRFAATPPQSTPAASTSHPQPA